MRVNDSPRAAFLTAAQRPLAARAAGVSQPRSGVSQPRSGVSPSLDSTVPTSSAPRILIVEDDAPIRRGVVDAMSFAGYQPIEAVDGPAALRELRSGLVDLVLLDVMLPRGVSGFDVLREIRSTHATLPVIMLTARGSENDRVEGLSGGADDYVVKPFSAKELLARVAAVLRRSPQRAAGASALRCGDAVICLRRREVRARGAVGELSERDAVILAHLASHRARAVHRDELLQVAWGLDPAGITTRTVDMQMMRLREKLGDCVFISTVRGVGYKLAESVEVQE
jgi:DNA-binding response OmpR family regulator